MSLFRYEALDRSGKIVMGTMDAQSEAAVDARLSQMGYRTERVMLAGGRTPSVSAAPMGRPISGPTSKLAGAKPKECALFYRQFAALVRSGITIYQSLEHLAPRTLQPSLKQTAKEMSDAARTGGRISDVMEKHPRVFPEHVVASIRAAEKGGFIEISLDEIALEYELQIAFYKGVWMFKALILQGLFAIALVQPFFTKLLAADKPGARDYDFAIQMREYFEVVLFRNVPITINLLGIGLLVLRWLYVPERALLRDRIALKIPVFGDLARQRSLSAFVRMLRRLFAAGIGPINAWEGAMSVAPNLVIRERLHQSYEMVQRNVPVHEAFAATGLFANETEQLLATGVVSGQLVDMMDRVAEYYQENVDRARANSRYLMLRLCGIAVVVLIGIAFMFMASSYKDALFNNPFVNPD